MIFVNVGQICDDITKQKVPRRLTRKFLCRKNFIFDEKLIFLLFKLWKQVKINSSFTIINPSKDFKKPLLAKTCFCFFPMAYTGRSDKLNLLQQASTQQWESKWCFVVAKILWIGKEREKQTYGIFYSPLLSLLYRYGKWRLAETKIRFHGFRSDIIAVTIVRFPSEVKYPGFLN